MAKLRTAAISREWLSLDDAANELAFALNEAITENDLWQLAYNNKLTLSFLLTNPTLAFAYTTYHISDDAFVKAHSTVDANKEKYSLHQSSGQRYLNYIKLLISLSKHTIPDLIDGQWLDQIWLNNPEYCGIDGVIDLPNDSHFKALVDYKIESVLGKENEYMLLANLPLIVKQGDIYFELIENLKDDLSPARYCDERSYRHIRHYDLEEKGEFVIRSENLQRYLAALDNHADASKDTATFSSQPQWNVKKPKATNDVNRIIYEALITLKNAGGGRPHNIKDLLPLINRSRHHGEWSTQKGKVLISTTSNYSRSVSSLNRTMLGLIEN